MQWAVNPQQYERAKKKGPLCIHGVGPFFYGITMKIKSILEFKAVGEYELSFIGKKLVGEKVYLIPELKDGEEAQEYEFVLYQKGRYGPEVKVKTPGCERDEELYSNLSRLYWRFPEKEKRAEMEELIKNDDSEGAKELQRSVISDYRANHFMMNYFQKDYNRRIELIEEEKSGKCNYCGCTCGKGN